MSTTILSKRPRRRRDIHRRDAPLLVPTLAHQPIAPVNPHNRGGIVVFEIPFRSRMAGSELEMLRRRLDMTTHVEHKLPADPNSPAVAQLDQSSSLLLEHGSHDDQWVLQARTWGAPSRRTVHDWQVRVAEVARRLDPGVPSPAHMPLEPSDTPQRAVGRAANRRLSGVRRRLAGLP